MIQLTPSAKERVKELMKQEMKPGAFFRVGVKEGCCEGMSYDYQLDDKLGESDKVYETDDVKVVCDAKSLPFLDGMAVDYANDCSKEGKEKEQFKFINPNAKGGCECGASFSV